MGDQGAGSDLEGLALRNYCSGSLGWPRGW